MHLRARRLVLLGAITAILLSAFYFTGGKQFLSAYSAGLFFVENATPNTLRAKYKNGDIGILVVSGHDQNSYGAQYRDTVEAYLNAELANYLFEFLRSDKKFTAFATHKSTAEYNGWILDYVKKNETAIFTFKEGFKNIFKEALRLGAVTRETKVHHNPAADNTSQMLYGINKWANENKIDIVLHIHFNDYPGRKYEVQGKYGGFSIYVPEKQLPNSSASKEIANYIRKELAKMQKESNFPKEKDIVVEDQELIAIGANATRENTSLLIEYGYIYEPQFTNKITRSQTLYNLAQATYLGIKNFFEEK